jgi:glucose/arabinose dehydrogenase
LILAAVIGVLLIVMAAYLPWPGAKITVAQPAANASSVTNATTSRLSTIPPSATLKDPDLEIQLVFRGLQFPTAMEFLGRDDILVLEKNNGTVKRIVNGVMAEEPVLDVEVANLVERGMLGIAIAKQDQENGATYVFLYYTEAGKDGSDAAGDPPLGNRLYRYELADGKLENGKLLLDIPAHRGASHNGGKMTIGPDGNLYLVVGDVAAHKTRSQNYQNSSTASANSVIFRLTHDGGSAGAILGRDEPVSKFYAYGIRNSFGMDFDPVTGKLWDTENGPFYGDEINLVEPGFNSGWAKITGTPQSSPINKQFDPEKDLVSCLYCKPSTGIFDKWFNQIFFGIQDGKYREPEFTWAIPMAPTAIKFLTSDRLGEQYENDAFVADVRGNIYHFELNENRDGLSLSGPLSDRVADTIDELEPLIFVQGFSSGIVDIDVGPDDYLYFLTYYGHDASIYRVVPKGTPPP